MTDEVARIAAAEAAVARARAQLSGTLAVLQRRLEPSRLAQEAKRNLADAGTLAAERTREAVRRRPGALAGAAAVAGLCLARHRIAALLRRKPKATASDDAS